MFSPLLSFCFHFRRKMLCICNKQIWFFDQPHLLWTALFQKLIHIDGRSATFNEAKLVFFKFHLLFIDQLRPCSEWTFQFYANKIICLVWASQEDKIKLCKLFWSRPEWELQGRYIRKVGQVERSVRMSLGICPGVSNPPFGAISAIKIVHFWTQADLKWYLRET